MNMAKAITQIRKEIPNQVDEQTQAVEDIIREIASNREAILETIGIMKELHETRVLEAVNALLKQRTEVGAIAIQQINQPAMHNIIKNGMNAFTFLGSVQPGQLDTILNGLSQGMQRLSLTAQNGEKQSLWKLRKRLWSPEIRSVMTMMINFMDGMGTVFLRNRRESE
jgi:uncharacterized protein YjgD (DUF1641 family)